MNLHPAFGDFYSLFNLPRAFALEPARLESAYLDVQGRVHPDRFAHLSENERRVSMQWAAHANEAYQTLRRPLSRARYLLELGGVDPEIESNTAMPTEFLMRQMMLREAVEEATDDEDADALDALIRELKVEARGLEAALGQDFDQNHDLPAAAGRVRQLMFLDRLQQEIRGALERLDN